MYRINRKVNVTLCMLSQETKAPAPAPVAPAPVAPAAAATPSSAAPSSSGSAEAEGAEKIEAKEEEKEEEKGLSKLRAAHACYLLSSSQRWPLPSLFL